MRRITPILASTAMLAALAACGGTTGVTKTVFATDAADTAVKALDDGKTLQSDSKTSSAMSVNHTTGDTAPTTADVSLAKNSQGGVTLTVNGVKQVFTGANATPDGHGYRVQTSNKDMSIYTWDKATVADALASSNTDYAQVWNYYVYNGKEPNTEGFAVLGTETKPDTLKGLPSATYNGRMTTKAYPNTGYVDNKTSILRLSGDVSMNADFGAGTVNGNIGNLTIRDPGTTTDVATSGSIAMDTAPISGNGFSGTLTPSGTFAGPTSTLTVSNGTYAGKFFGPNADQVGGTIGLKGNYDGEDGSGSGFFKASK